MNRCRESPFSMLDRGEHALDGIGGPQAYPMLGWEVVKGQQYGRVLSQALAFLGVLRTVRFEEQFERALCNFTRIGHPDLVQLFIRCWLQSLGKLVDDVATLTEPAALLKR